MGRRCGKEAWERSVEEEETWKGMSSTGDQDVFLEDNYLPLNFLSEFPSDYYSPDNGTKADFVKGMDSSAILSLVLIAIGCWLMLITSVLYCLTKGKYMYLVVLDRRRSSLVVAREGGECPICLEEFQEEEMVSELTCKHQYHTECIQRWMLSSLSTSCPTCRDDEEGPGCLRTLV